MVRSYSNIAVQIGVEAQAGQAAPANKRLMGLSLDPHAAFETQQHKPSGYKVATVSSVTTETTEADWEGPIDYKNIVYPLSSLFGAAVITKPEGATKANMWAWTFTGKGAVAPKTFSVEVGDATRASKFSYGAFTSMDLSIDRTGENTMSGSMVGQALQVGASMTAAPTEIEIVPVNGDHWDVFADVDSGAIGGTQLEAVYEAGLNFGDMFSQEFTINSAKKSFTSLYDSEEPSLEWNMMLGADSVAEGYFDRLRNGQKTFIRLQATGPEIEAGHNYAIEIDMCVIPTEFDAYESNDGIYVLPINFALAYDAAWGKSMVIKVTNDLTAL